MDTAGQERYHDSLPKQYLRDSHVVLLVFSNLEDLEVLKNRWFDYYKENSNSDKSKFIVVGNKSDIFGENEEEIKRLGHDFAEDIDAFFITCSAKSKDNIDNLENHILTEIKRIIDEEEKEKKNQSNEPNKENTVQNNEKQKLDKEKASERKKNKGGCC